MKAISIMQPWAWAILHAGKNVENRTWKMPRWVRGETLWLHTGKRADTADAWDVIEDVSGLRPPPKNELVFGAVVGVVRFGMAVECAPDGTPPINTPWASGPWCWIIAMASAMFKPVPCLGKLGFWVPPEMDGHPITRRVDH